MTIKLLWYLTPPDGPYPWEEAGRWVTGFEQLKQIAVVADRLGYYGSLLGTSPNSNLATAAALIDATQRLRFLIAQYPGELSPAKRKVYEAIVAGGLEVVRREQR